MLPAAGLKKGGAVLNPRYDHQVVVQCRLIRVLNLGPYRRRFGLIPLDGNTRTPQAHTSLDKAVSLLRKCFTVKHPLY